MFRVFKAILGSRVSGLEGSGLLGSRVWGFRVFRSLV